MIRAPSRTLDRAAPLGVSLQSIRSVKGGMANAPVDPDESRAAAVADVKRLMRLARTGALATLEAREGRPSPRSSASPAISMARPCSSCRRCRVTPGTSRNDPRASLLLTGRPERGDPLNHPRVTLNRAGRTMRRRRAPRPGIYSAIRRLASMRASPISPSTSSGSRTCISTAASAAPRPSRRPRSLPRARAKPHWRTPRSGSSRKRTRWAQPTLARLAGHKAVAAGLAGDRARRRGPRPRSGRARRPGPIRNAGAGSEGWRERLEQRLAAG